MNHRRGKHRLTRKTRTSLRLRDRADRAERKPGLVKGTRGLLSGAVGTLTLAGNATGVGATSGSR